MIGSLLLTMGLPLLTGTAVTNSVALAADAAHAQGATTPLVQELTSLTWDKSFGDPKDLSDALYNEPRSHSLPYFQERAEYWDRQDNLFLNAIDATRGPRPSIKLMQAMSERVNGVIGYDYVTSYVTSYEQELANAPQFNPRQITGDQNLIHAHLTTKLKLLQTYHGVLTSELRDNPKLLAASTSSNAATPLTGEKPVANQVSLTALAVNLLDFEPANTSESGETSRLPEFAEGRLGMLLPLVLDYSVKQLPTLPGVATQQEFTRLNLAQLVSYFAAPKAYLTRYFDYKQISQAVRSNYFKLDFLENYYGKREVSAQTRLFNSQVRDAYFKKAEHVAFLHSYLQNFAEQELKHAKPLNNPLVKASVIAFDKDTLNQGVRVAYPQQMAVAPLLSASLLVADTKLNEELNHNIPQLLSLARILGGLETPSKPMTYAGAVVRHANNLYATCLLHHQEVDAVRVCTLDLLTATTATRVKGLYEAQLALVDNQLFVYGRAKPQSILAGDKVKAGVILQQLRTTKTQLLKEYKAYNQQLESLNKRLQQMVNAQ